MADFRTVMLTGGAGFIGTALCRRLLGDSRVRVINFDKLTYAANRDGAGGMNGHPRYRLVRADIADAPAVAAALDTYRPDAVVHLAAETHVDRSIDGPGAFVSTNVWGTAVLIEEVQRYRDRLDAASADRLRFLHVSTDEVYGSLGEAGAFREDSPYDPRSPYAASKAASDHLVSAWRHTYGFPALISNCSNNYGPCQFPEKLIPLMILNALDGLPLSVYGDGRNVRDWLHVDDHARALTMILADGKVGERYHVGGASERSNLSVVEAIADLVDACAPPLPGGPRRRLIRFVEDRPGHDRRYAMDIAKIGAELGWRPTMTFEDGLERTVRWYMGHRDWWAPLRERVYGGARLGVPAVERISA